jgi:hypothetical protein
MLSNKDFAKILANGGGGGGRSEGDGKFDLNQIRVWDQQNRAKEQRKNTKKESSKTVVVEKEEGDTADMYRDRAQERRNDANPDYDALLEAAAQLNADQTQFLGGDTEHTHLVKGLDYALLRKVRSEGDKVRDQEQEEGDQEKASSRHQHSSTRLAEVATHSDLGANMKKLLLGDAGGAVRSCGGKVRAAAVPSGVGSSGSGSVLTRTAYQFDVDPLGESDLPTVIRRSKAVRPLLLLDILLFTATLVTNCCGSFLVGGRRRLWLGVARTCCRRTCPPARSCAASRKCGGLQARKGSVGDGRDHAPRPRPLLPLPPRRPNPATSSTTWANTTPWQSGKEARAGDLEKLSRCSRTHRPLLQQ